MAEEEAGADRRAGPERLERLPRVDHRLVILGLEVGEPLAALVVADLDPEVDPLQHQVAERGIRGDVLLDVLAPG